MNKTKKLVISVLCCAVLGSALAGCGGNDTNNGQNNNQNQNNNQTQTLSGDLNLGGSTSVEAVVTAALDEFIAQNPDVSGKYDATGSSTGMQNAIDGTYHVGFASREVKDEEKSQGLTAVTFALDGIAVAVNPENPVKDLTVEQLLGIYTGEITNWSELGGNDAAIVVVSRENGSGTRSAFEELVGIEDNLVEGATVKDANGTVATYIAQEPNAIGYISFVTLEENAGKVTGLKVEGVDATVENVKNSTYKLSRPFALAYKEENLNEAEKAFVEFIMSDEGQKIVVDKGAITVK